MLLIEQVQIITPHGRIENGAVLVADGRICAVGPAHSLSRPAGTRLLSGAGGWLVPGFIDLQVNGALGHDLTSEPTAIWEVASALLRYGITSFLPTIITSPAETASAAQETLRAGPPANFHGAQPLGLHLEGPFLNPAKKGAHSPAHLRAPCPELIEDWSPDAGVRLVTIAPELPGALALVSALAQRGVVVSAGHSMATMAETQAGVAAGISYGTHLFNAMAPLHHREPGITGALLADEQMTVGLIPDGVHVHPALVRLIWQMTGPNRLNLVSDAMAALGMAPGNYFLGDHLVTVDNVCCRLADGTLAGSILGLDAAVRNLMDFTGCTLADALSTVTTVPARLLGLENNKGSIEPGFDADLVLLSPELQVVATIVAGEVVYA